ncbi:MAG: YebC/PmpR family DNA-binding transcriptional regulator [Planctomycetes bacterium]|nr:YebC/PmpR family DNA-binding transcriptional regulator [Planctomycetota bacterium]
MAGHSAWKNIKHRKAAVDARRGKMWSKCARAIIVAARVGGGDPAANLSLRYAIDEARFFNMPRETIEKAIKKGTGELTGEHYESFTYEGYGPSGVAMMLEILTDNRNRTSPDIKGIFEDHGGNLGTSGCVSYMFQSLGEIILLKSAATEERLMEVVLDAGAEDVRTQGEMWQVLCKPASFMAVRAAVEKAGLAIQSSGMTMIPSTMVTLTGEEAKRVLALIEALEDNDDVQKVHANLEIPDSELAALG